MEHEEFHEQHRPYSPDQAAEAMVQYWDICTHYADIPMDSERGSRISYPADLLALADQYGDSAEDICSNPTIIDVWMRSGNHHQMRKAAITVETASAHVMHNSFNAVFQNQDWRKAIPELDQRVDSTYTLTEAIFRVVCQHTRKEIENLYAYIHQGGIIEEPIMERVYRQGEARLRAVYDELGLIDRGGSNMPRRSSYRRSIDEHFNGSRYYPQTQGSLRLKML